MLRRKNLTLDPGNRRFRDAPGWWSVARETDATPVWRWDDCDRFLFYDAYLECNPPVETTWEPRLRIRNAGDAALAHVFAVEVAEGACRFGHRRRLEPGREVELELKRGLPDLVAILLDQGLYRREAVAFAEIWKDEFFGKAGRRVLAVLPRSAYDRLHPVRIEPKPDELVRVMVAKIECGAALDVAKLAAELASEDLDVRAEAERRLRDLGPRAARALRRAKGDSADPDVRARLDEILQRARRVPKRAPGKFPPMTPTDTID